MSGGGGTTSPTSVTTTQNRDPWSGAVPYLNQTMGSAQGLYNSDVGYQPYPGSGVVNPYTLNDYNTAVERARYLTDQNPYGSAGLHSAQANAADVVRAQGITPGIQGALGGMGNIASLANNQQNPYLQDILSANNRQIADRVNSSMAGAGRYGSGAHTDVLTRALAESANPILAQDYEARQGRGLQANQLMAGIYGQGLNTAGQYSQTIPMLDAAQFANIDRRAGMGDAERAYYQANLNDQIARYNAQQARPWEQLGRYNAIIGGAGGLGGSQTMTQPIQQPSLLQSIGGGAIAGAGLGSMFGPWGAPLGAVGGGLLGLMGR